MFKTIIATVSAIIILNVLGGLGLGIIITAALIYIFKRGSQENPADYINNKPLDSDMFEEYMGIGLERMFLSKDDE